MTLDPQTVQRLRIIFKYVNRLILLYWRLGLGKWLNCSPAVLGRYMVIVHTGRKSGKRRYTPLNYTEVDGEIYCTAGFGRMSDWYRNIQTNPQIEIWLPDGWWSGYANDITDSPDKLRLLRSVLNDSGFAALVAGVHPTTISEQDLEALTIGYCLVHICRAEARTGPGGPGEWAWIWPVSAILLAWIAFRPRRCRDVRHH